MALTKARTLGVKGVMIPSAGNAGGAAAVYGARGGIPVAVVVPRGTPEAAVAEAIIAGAHVFTVDGSIATAGKLIARHRVRRSAGSISPRSRSPTVSRARRPWGSSWPSSSAGTTPDVLMYPTGGGTGLVGIWKAFDELAAMGWIKAAQPRFIAVQAEGCAPLVKAWEEKAETTTLWENPVTNAPGAPRAGALRGTTDAQDHAGHGRARARA